MTRLMAVSIAVAASTYSGCANAQSLSDISPGMSYDEVRQYALSDPHLMFEYFDKDKIGIADRARAYVPGIEFRIAFCPGSNYDGKVVTVAAIKTYNTEKSTDPIQMIQTYHDLFIMMSGDKLSSVIGTRTETEQGRTQGYAGVSISHLLKNGETWDLGIFNRPESQVQAIQLQRSIAANAVCKKQ
jgi:hypothetical protein